MTTIRSFDVDVVIVGAGPAGLSAASAAGAYGRSVMVLDQGLRTGGQIWRHRTQATLPVAARRLIADAIERATIISGARVVDAEPAGRLIAELPDGVAQIRARAVILATGAKERFVPFPGWTLPGVVGVGGLQALIKSGVSMRGARVVISGTGPLLWPVAATAVASGAEVVLVAEHAEFATVAQFGLSLWQKPAAVAQAIGYRWGFRHVPLRFGAWPVAATGDHRVRAVTIHSPRGDEQIPCDWVAAAAGLVPNTELAQLIGCGVDDGAVVVDTEQRTTVPNVWAVGECTGIKGDAAAIAEGAIAGAVAAGASSVAPSLARKRRTGMHFASTMRAAFAPRPELGHAMRPDTVICRCEDVRLADVNPAWSQRQAKLWTRIGMGECQGAVCGPACASLFGWDANIPRPPLAAPTCGAWSAALNAREDGDLG